MLFMLLIWLHEDHGVRHPIQSLILLEYVHTLLGLVQQFVLNLSQTNVLARERQMFIY